MSETNVTEMKMPAIVITGKDIQDGFWESFHKLLNDKGLEFTVKARVSGIFKELDQKTRELQVKYEEAMKDVKFEGEGQARKCLEPEKVKDLDNQFKDMEIFIQGRKIKAEKLENAGLTARDLLRLEPIIEGI